MIGEIIGILGKVAGTVAGNLFPDPEHELKRIELQQALQAAVLERTSEIERAAADVVKAEAHRGRAGYSAPGGRLQCSSLSA